MNFLDDSYLSPLPVKLYGRGYIAPSLAHAYWACRVQDHSDSVAFVLAAPTAAEARTRADSRLPNLNWKAAQEQIRKSLQRLKFSEPPLREALLTADPDAVSTRGLSFRSRAGGGALPVVRTCGWSAPPMRPGRARVPRRAWRRRRP